MPGGSGIFRATAWRLNKDYSIDIQGRSVVAEMYDLLSVNFPLAWALWGMSETSGVRFDCSGNGHNLEDGLTTYWGPSTSGSQSGPGGSTIKHRYFYHSGGQYIPLSFAEVTWTPAQGMGPFLDVLPQADIDTLNALDYPTLYNGVWTDVTQVWEYSEVCTVNRPPAYSYSQYWTSIACQIWYTGSGPYTFNRTSKRYGTSVYDYSTGLARVAGPGQVNYAVQLTRQASGQQPQLIRYGFPDLSNNHAFTLAFWFKAHDAGVGSYSLDFNSPIEFWMDGTTDGKLEISVYTHGTLYFDPGEIALQTQDAWHLFIFKFNGAVGTVKIDDQVKATKSGTCGFSASDMTSPIYLYCEGHAGTTVQCAAPGIWTECYNANKSTRDRAVRFFIKAAGHAGISLSKRLNKAAGNGRRSAIKL